MKIKIRCTISEIKPNNESEVNNEQKEVKDESEVNNEQKQVNGDQVEGSKESKDSCDLERGPAIRVGAVVIAETNSFCCRKVTLGESV